MHLTLDQLVVVYNIRRDLGLTTSTSCVVAINNTHLTETIPKLRTFCFSYLMMKPSTLLLLPALVIPHLGSALSCQTKVAACGLPQPNIDCNCQQNYPAGATINVQCSCTEPYYSGGVEHSSTFYKDGEDWWVNADHLTCTGSPAEGCSTCIGGQC